MSKDILIDTFISLTRTLSFSKTAQELGISQQAVSKNISRLEQRLGFPVLTRNAHNVALTDWGKQFLELNTFYDQNLAVIKDRFLAENNTVQLQTLNQPEFAFLEKLPPVYLSHPGMEVKIQTEIANPDAAIFNLMEDSADLIVTLDRFISENDELMVVPVHSFEICFLVSKKHPLYQENVDYMVFRNEPFIAGTSMDKHFGKSHDFIQNDIASMGLDPETIIMKTSTEEAEKSAAQGEGIIMGTSFLTPYSKKRLAAVQTGRFTKAVCVYKKNTRKYYLKKVTEYIADAFKTQYGEN